jgi:hypothetical protein
MKSIKRFSEWDLEPGPLNELLAQTNRDLLRLARSDWEAIQHMRTRKMIETFAAFADNYSAWRQINKQALREIPEELSRGGL